MSKFGQAEVRLVRLCAALFVTFTLITGLGISAASANTGTAIVQQNNAGCTSCSSVSVSFASPVTSGDEIIVLAAANYGSIPFPNPTITDTLSLPFGPGPGACYGGACVSLFFATATSGGPEKITATLFTALSSIDVYIYEVSGVSSPVGFPSNGSGPGCTTPPCTDYFATSSRSYGSGDILLAVIADQNGGSSSLTTGAGFNQSPQNSGDKVGFAEYSLPTVSSTTDYPASVTGRGPPPSGGPSGTWVEFGIDLPALPRPSGVPQFPNATLQPLLLIALLLPVLLIARKRLAGPSHYSKFR